MPKRIGPFERSWTHEQYSVGRGDRFDAFTREELLAMREEEKEGGTLPASRRGVAFKRGDL